MGGLGSRRKRRVLSGGGGPGPADGPGTGEQVIEGVARRGADQGRWSAPLLGHGQYVVDHRRTRNQRQKRRVRIRRGHSRSGGPGETLWMHWPSSPGSKQSPRQSAQQCLQ
jgi:hypothetical protein